MVIKIETDPATPNVDFEAHKQHLNGQIDALYAEAIVKPIVLLQRISGLKANFDQAFAMAAKTPTPEDDEELDVLRQKLINVVADRIKGLSISDPDKVALNHFIQARLRLSQAINGPKSEYSEIQQNAAKVAVELMDSSAKAISEAAIPKTDRDYLDGMITVATDEYGKSGLKDLSPLLENLGVHDLSQALAEVDEQQFNLPKDTVAIADLKLFLSKMANIVSKYNSDENSRKLSTTDEGKLERVLNNQVPFYRDKYKNNSAALRELSKLEQIVREILHESYVGKLGGSLGEDRDYLRPTIGHLLPAGLDGFIEMFIGSMNEQVSHADALGMMIGTGMVSDGSANLHPDDVQFLENFLNDFEKKLARQLIQMRGAMDVTLPENIQFEEDFMTYMEKYRQWINLLISTVEPAVNKKKGGPGGGGPGGPGGSGSVDTEDFDEDIMVVVRELLKQARDLKLTIEAKSFQGSQDLPISKLYKKYVEYLATKPTDSEGKAKQAAIKKWVEITSLSVDLQETNGGWKQQGLYESRGMFEFAVLNGPVKGFHTFLNELMPNPAYQSGVVNGKRVKYPPMEEMRELAKKLLTIGHNNFDVSDLANCGEQLKKEVLGGYSLPRKNPDGTPMTDIDGHPMYEDFPGIKNLYEELPDYALEFLWAFISVDMPDYVFAAKRAKGGSVGLGHANGGSFALDGITMSCLTDALSPLSAADYELNNKIESGKSHVMNSMLYDEASQAGSESMNRPGAIGEYRELFTEYLEAIFEPKQLDVMIGQLHISTSELQFPTLTQAIQEGWVGAVQDYYTALSGFMYLCSELWSDFHDLSEKHINKKFTDWFSLGIGKYKLVKSGLSDEFVKVATRVYLARLMTSGVEPNTGRFDRGPQNLITELIPNLWKATTANELEGNPYEKLQLKIDLIADMFDENNRSRFYAKRMPTEALQRIEDARVKDERDKLIAILTKTPERQLGKILKQFGIANHLLPYERTSALLKYLTTLWERANRNAGPINRLNKSLENLKATFGMTKKSRHVPVPYLEPEKEEKSGKH